MLMTIILIRINTYGQPAIGRDPGNDGQIPRLMSMCTQMLAA
jgi:hypothetical protein